MLSHRPHIDHHRKRFTIEDCIVSSSVDLQICSVVYVIIECVQHLTLDGDPAKARSPRSARSMMSSYKMEERWRSGTRDYSFAGTSASVATRGSTS